MGLPLFDIDPLPRLVLRLLPALQAVVELLNLPLSLALVERLFDLALQFEHLDTLELRVVLSNAIEALVERDRLIQFGVDVFLDDTHDPTFREELDVRFRVHAVGLDSAEVLGLEAKYERVFGLLGGG